MGRTIRALAPVVPVVALRREGKTPDLVQISGSRKHPAPEGSIGFPENGDIFFPETCFRKVVCAMEGLAGRPAGFRKPEFWPVKGLARRTFRSWKSK